MEAKTRNIPLSLDEQLLSEIDSAAAEVKDSRSAVMRRAIREGLPLVKSGGKADVLTLDSELSAEVDQAAKEIDFRRGKILLEAIRTGLAAFLARKTSEKVSLAGLKDPNQREQIIRAVEESFMLYDDPLRREHGLAIVQRGKLQFYLDDLLRHVPEAKHRFDLINTLAEIRNGPGGPGGGTSIGLSTAELEWQIGMSKKHGPHPAAWPDEEKRAHNAQIDSDRVSYDLTGQIKQGIDSDKPPAHTRHVTKNLRAK